MKTLLLPLTLLTSLEAYAQKTVPEVRSIDFLNPSAVTRYTSAAYGSKIVVRIQNFNRHLYKVNESFTQSDFNTSLPGIFSGVKLPDYLNLALPNAIQNAERTTFLP